MASFRETSGRDSSCTVDRDFHVRCADLHDLWRLHDEVYERGSTARQQASLTDVTEVIGQGLLEERLVLGLVCFGPFRIGDDPDTARAVRHSARDSTRTRRT